MLLPTVQLNGDDTVGSGTLVFSAGTRRNDQVESYVLTSFHVVRNIQPGGLRGHGRLRPAAAASSARPAAQGARAELDQPLLARARPQHGAPAQRRAVGAGIEPVQVGAEEAPFLDRHEGDERLAGSAACRVASSAPAAGLASWMVPLAFVTSCASGERWKNSA